MPNQFWSWLYQYGIGGIFFAVTLVAIVKFRALDFSIKSQRHLVFGLVVGFAVFAIVHGLWVWAAARTPLPSAATAERAV